VTASDDLHTFHTVGPNCHWCYERGTAYVWGPYGTNVCEHCQGLISEGRDWEVVEALAARMTVRGGWHMLDPEGWRQREHERMARWLSIRTDCRPA
jgi:hypothetical protein